MDIEDISAEAVASEYKEILDSLPVEARVTAYFKFPPSWSDMGGENSRAFRLDSRVKRFSSDAPVWVGRVYFFTDEPKLLKPALFTAFGFDGRRIDGKFTALDDRAYVDVRDLIVGFEVQGVKGSAYSKVSSIQVNGFSLKAFSKAVEVIQEAASLREDLDDRVNGVGAELDSLKSEYSELQFERDALLEDRDALQVELEELKSSKSKSAHEVAKQAGSLLKVKNLIAELQSKESLLTNNIAQLTEHSADLNRKIAKENVELLSLTTDRNLISDEYRDYVKEGKAQSRIYVASAVVPMLAILFSVWQVYVGASTVLNTSYSGFLDILSAFAQRIPFTLVLGLVVFYSWILISSLLGKIFEIHNDRLILARLLVIAKDTVFSSAQGLDLSDEVKFRERAALKIQLLKSHLSRELSPDFEYKGRVDSFVPQPHAENEEGPR